VDKIATGAVTQGKIAANAVIEDKIAAGAVTEGKIAANAVTNAKIAANAVTGPKIATNAVTQGKIAANAVIEDKIADGAVTEAKIAASAVTEGKIQNDAVTNVKLANMPQNTLKGRYTPGLGNPENLTQSQVATILGLWQVASVNSTQAQSFSSAGVIKFQSIVPAGISYGITVDIPHWRLIASVAGVYLLTFDCVVSDAFSGSPTIYARVNGGTASYSGYGPGPIPLGPLHLHVLVPLSVSDYVDLVVYPSAGDTGTLHHVHCTLLRVA